jgi:hypothetical protein
LPSAAWAGRPRRHIDWCRAQGLDLIRRLLPPACVPAIVDTGPQPGTLWHDELPRSYSRPSSWQNRGSRSISVCTTACAPTSQVHRTYPTTGAVYYPNGRLRSARCCAMPISRTPCK